MYNCYVQGFDAKPKGGLDVACVVGYLEGGVRKESSHEEEKERIYGKGDD